MNTKNIIIFVVAGLAIAGGSFYGGMKYDQSKKPANRLGNFQNMTQEERQARLQQFANGTGGNMVVRGNTNGGGFTTGEIVSKDDKSITLKLRDGSSKVIFYSASTNVRKTVSGTSSDLNAGEQISVQGTTNQDGSITAQSIQTVPTPTSTTTTK